MNRSNQAGIETCCLFNVVVELGVEEKRTKLAASSVQRGAEVASLCLAGKLK